MTLNERQNLHRQYHVPKHILAHMRVVAGVCEFIAKKMIGKGLKVDLTTLLQAANLHDLVKICDFKELDLTGFNDFTGEDVVFWGRLIKSCHRDGHIVAVCNILRDLKEDLLAEIIAKHRFNCLVDPDPASRPRTWEEKILYYADKRVMHDRITGIRERLEDGRKRYFPGGNAPPEDAAVERAILKLEKQICKAAGIRPEDINNLQIKKS